MKLEYLIILILLYYFYESSIKEAIYDKKNDKYIKENIKVGSKIISKAGIIGIVTEINKNSLIIVTGSEKNISHIEIDKDSVKAIIEK